jgi:Tfp pilus assembly protein PilX
MRHPVDSPARRARLPGFVLPVVMGMILVAAALALHATSDLGTHALLSTQRLLHQRAFEAGESGIVAAIERLDAGDTVPQELTLTSSRFPADTAEVRTLTLSQQAVPAGFSMGRVVALRQEIRSTGRSARGARITLVQGLVQMQPASP